MPRVDCFEVLAARQWLPDFWGPGACTIQNLNLHSPLFLITAALILAVSSVLLSEGHHLFYCLLRISLQSPASLPGVGGRGQHAGSKHQTALQHTPNPSIGLFLAQASTSVLLILQPLETFFRYMKWIISLPPGSLSRIQFSWFCQANYHP